MGHNADPPYKAVRPQITLSSEEAASQSSENEVRPVAISFAPSRDAKHRQQDHDDDEPDDLVGKEKALKHGPAQEPRSPYASQADISGSKGDLTH
jgi:hypothetical protein